MLTIAKILIVLCSLEYVYSASSLVDYNKCAGIAYEKECVNLGSKFYLVVSNIRANWFEAHRFCRRQKADLVTIESSSEADLISQYLISQGYGQNSLFWTGGNALMSNRRWYSVHTGDLLPYRNWTPGQPDNSGGNENCVMLWMRPNVFGMNDANCDRNLNVICEL